MCVGGDGCGAVVAVVVATEVVLVVVVVVVVVLQRVWCWLRFSPTPTHTLHFPIRYGCSGGDGGW